MSRDLISVPPAFDSWGARSLWRPSWEIQPGTEPGSLVRCAVSNRSPGLLEGAEGGRVAGQRRRACLGPERLWFHPSSGFGGAWRKEGADLTALCAR